MAVNVPTPPVESAVGPMLTKGLNELWEKVICRPGQEHFADSRLRKTLPLLDKLPSPA
jgi:hypothetical protein